jgi:uncharacterized protein
MVGCWLKWSKYNVVTPALVPGRVLVFNARTGSSLELLGEDASLLLLVKETPTAAMALLREASNDLLGRLKHAGALVPTELDERAAILEGRERALGVDGPCSFTIAPTVQCNFRCPYCFESHSSSFMNARTEAALIEFVKRMTPPSAPLSICWFGGEPLLQAKLVVRVSKELRAHAATAGSAFSLSMITNGYLLSESVCDQLQLVGPWSLIPGTIDGEAELHNNRRPTVNGKGTWARIVEGVLRSLERCLPVTIRVNVDRTSSVDYRALVASLLDANVLPRAQIYLGHVVAATSVVPGRDLELDHREMAVERLKLARALLSVGLPPSLIKPTVKCGPMCTAESSLGFVVAPDGALFKCWNEIAAPEGKSIGSVHDRHVRPPDDVRIVARTFEKEDCSKCHALPVCQGGCGWEARRFASHGSCDTYRFFPETVLKLDHAHQLSLLGSSLQGRTL